MFLLMRKRPSIIKDAPIHHCRDNISPNTTLPNKACGKKEKFKIFQTACYRGGEELVERGFRISGVARLFKLGGHFIRWKIVGGAREKTSDKKTVSLTL